MATVNRQFPIALWCKSGAVPRFNYSWDWMGLCVVFAFPSSMFLCFLRLSLMLQCLSNVWYLFFAVFLCISSLRSMFWLQFWESFLYIECFSCFSMPMALQEKQTFSSRGCSLNLSIYIYIYTCIILYVSSCGRPISSRSPAVYICPTCSEPWHIQVTPVHHTKVIWFSHPFAHFCP